MILTCKWIWGNAVLMFSHLLATAHTLMMSKMQCNGNITRVTFRQLESCLQVWKKNESIRCLLGYLIYTYMNFSIGFLWYSPATFRPMVNHPWREIASSSPPKLVFNFSANSDGKKLTKSIGKPLTASTVTWLIPTISWLSRVASRVCSTKSKIIAHMHSIRNNLMKTKYASPSN